MTQAVTIKEQSRPTARKLVYEFFSREGSTTDHQAAIDASEAPVRFVFKPEHNRPIHIEHILQIMSGVGPMAWGDYGTIPRLTNGVGLTIEGDGETIVDLFHGIKIKENSGWKIAAEDHFMNDGGVPPAVGPLEPSLAHAEIHLGAHGFALRIGPDEQIVFTINDNFLGLTNQFFGVRGHYV